MSVNLLRPFLRLEKKDQVCDFPSIKLVVVFISAECQTEIDWTAHSSSCLFLENAPLNEGECSRNLLHSNIYPAIKNTSNVNNRNGLHVERRFIVDCVPRNIASEGALSSFSHYLLHLETKIRRDAASWLVVVFIADHSRSQKHLQAVCCCVDNLYCSPKSKISKNPPAKIRSIYPKIGSRSMAEVREEKGSASLVSQYSTKKGHDLKPMQKCEGED